MQVVDQLPPLLSKSPSLLTQANALALGFHSHHLQVLLPQQPVIFLKGASDQVILPKNIWDVE